MNEVRLIGKGNVNIVISFGDNDILYWISIRFKELKTNNEYTLKNRTFIQNEIIPIFSSYLYPMEICELQLTPKLTELYSKYISVDSMKSNMTVSFKFPNLNPYFSISKCLYNDHQTRLFYDIIY